MTENIYEAPKSEISNDLGGTVSLTLKEVLFSFKGRIPRKTYWLTFLGMIAVGFVFVVLAGVLGLSESVLGIFIIILYFPLIWISLAIQVKRWHDRDKSGWWVLVSFIPVIGPIWAFIENGCLAGSTEINNYGPPSA